MRTYPAAICRQAKIAIEFGSGTALELIEAAAVDAPKLLFHKP
jgi:hypothetical protein